MSSDITTKVMAAIAGVLAAEITDRMLDWMDLSEKLPKLPREIIKAVAGAVAALLTEGLMDESGRAVDNILQLTSKGDLLVISESANREVA
jgi:hypothetical protein